jgi:hypothetical protein
MIFKKPLTQYEGKWINYSENWQGIGANVLLVKLREKRGAEALFYSIAIFRNSAEYTTFHIPANDEEDKTVKLDEPKKQSKKKLFDLLFSEKPGWIK